MDDEQLDRLLARVTPPLVPAALERRILADQARIAARGALQRWLGGVADALWPDMPVWQPVGALALALVIGLGIAAYAPVEMAQSDDSSFAFDSTPDMPQEDLS